MCSMFDKMSEDVHARKKLRNEDIDMLSNLPDPILLQIISKLQTKDAVATSLLSSRYESLWKNVNSLRFSNWFIKNHSTPEKERQSFTHFVNRVFILLKSKSIHKFVLRISGLFPVYDVSTWFTAAIIRNLKVLKFDAFEEEGPENPDDCIVMPSCFYTCKTLEALELCWKVFLSVPEFVCLPKLTSIQLEHVKFSSDESVRRLISGCSSLEYLSIDRYEFDNVGTFTIDSPTLIGLNYGFYSNKGFMEQNFKFELNAPKLRYFYLRDNTTRDFVSDSLCSLEDADIRVSCPQELNDPDTHYERVVKLLQVVHNVNHLWIAGDTLEALSHVPAPQIYSRNLTSSTLIMGQNNFKRSVQDLLEGSDKSHDIYLSKDSSDTTHVVHWREPEELPICLLSCLKTISVCRFRGRESELNMIAYILKNAKVLKKMTISEATSEAEANFELREKILKFDQGSGRCEITFSWEAVGAI